MYAKRTNILGKIDVSGLGCLAGDGIARGQHVNSLCSGSGGGHGGRGGRGRMLVNSPDDIRFDDCAQF
jgi:hypothetical protein